MTFDNASNSRGITVYVDGGEAESVSDVNGLEDLANSPLQVGARSGAFGFQGRIQDLQVYNKVITAGYVAFLGSNPGEELVGDTVIGPDPNANSDGDRSVRHL